MSTVQATSHWIYDGSTPALSEIDLNEQKSFMDRTRSEQFDVHKRQRRATVGETVFGALFPNRGTAWASSWGSDRIKEVTHLRNWTYVAIKPNIAYVRHKQIPGRTFKSFHRDATFGGYNEIWGSQFEPPYRRKALSVVRPHEELEPLEADAPLRRLIENPNPMDTSFDLFYESQMFLELCGVSYLWAIPNDWGVPCELWTLPSHWVWPRTGGGKYVPPR